MLFNVVWRNNQYISVHIGWCHIRIFHSCMTTVTMCEMMICMFVLFFLYRECYLMLRNTQDYTCMFVGTGCECHILLRNNHMHDNCCYGQNWWHNRYISGRLSVLWPYSYIVNQCCQNSVTWWRNRCVCWPSMFEDVRYRMWLILLGILHTVTQSNVCDTRM